jgi:penicillin-binding protein 1A
MRAPLPPPEQQDPPGPRQPTKLVLVDVPPPRWWKRFFKFFAFMALTGATAALFVAGFLYWKYSDGLPDIPQVDQYRPPILTEVVTQDAVLAGEFYNERRKVVPYERIPKRLVQAFIASEDSSFFDHFGVDVLGTGRAAFKTIMKKVTGRGSVQGGSTLTQQTAKAVLVSAEGYKSATEKSLKRKVREALLATRLESALTKEEILYLYLNNVYLGHHSYGVQAAAENYYRKDVKDLTLGEIALIAGLPQAPSQYSPFVHPEAAIKRRRYVLGRMLTEGMITKAEHDQAVAEEVHVYPVEDVFHEFAPYFTEEVRRNVVDRYGNKALLNEGLKVFTTMDSEKQRAAQEAVLANLLVVDKRQGFRGPVQQLPNADARKAFIEKSKKVMGEEKLTMGKFYVGVVTSIAKDDQSADINVGGQVAKLPLLGMRWARKLNAEQYYPSVLINKVSSALKVGDVEVVRVVEKKDLYDDKEAYSESAAKEVPETGILVRLEQEPELQAALVSIDPHRQYMVAMVGGYDFDANEYNRAFQACRQPGSNFKPIEYSAAVEKMEWTEATIIVDSPIVEHDPEHQNTWKPENYGSDFVGEVVLRTALINSMNIPAVKTFIALAKYLGNKNEVIGIQKIGEYAKELGLSTPINPDYSAALGSSCVYPFELANVYATFNRLGLKKPTYFVRKVEDRFGRPMEDHSAFDDPWASMQDRVAGGYARLYEPGVQVIAPETGWIVTDLMRGVVREGTGAPAQKLGKPAAGKTGTTNDSFDAWFTGFTRDLVTTSWVGYDMNPHPLGKYETGGRAALPAWVGYMKTALDGKPQPEFYPPANLDLVKLRIDTKSGKVASPGAKGSVDMWFKKGTEPKDAALAPGQADPSRFDMMK